MRGRVHGKRKEGGINQDIKKVNEKLLVRSQPFSISDWKFLVAIFHAEQISYEQTMHSFIYPSRAVYTALC